MKIGMVGCGKLGLMVALSIESRGHEVKGYDVNPAVAGYLKDRTIPFKEEHADELLRETRMEMVPLQELCDWADIIFMAIQTPHDPRYEGATRLPEERVDFDYSHLIACVSQVDSCLKTPKLCVIISTVLPGTLDRDILPIISDRFRLVYEPLFIAMGTVYRDFLHPEFVLMGVDEPGAANELEEFYKTIHSKPALKTDIRTAEGIKVFYNTFITAKTVLANLYGEAAHKLGMNVDDIFKAVTLSTDRLLSSKYLQAGMGDGGGCHPRDNIALSFIARKELLSFDFFEALMVSREKHCEWLADLIYREACNIHRQVKVSKIWILGRSFKPETNIEAGSPALLVANILKEWDLPEGCLEHVEDMTPQLRGVYFIATKHDKYRYYNFPEGSTVIDPFRYLPKQPGVNLVSIGAGRTEKVRELVAQ